MTKTLKAFGVYCAIESVAAIALFITALMCASVEAYDGLIVGLLLAAAFLAVGAYRFRSRGVVTSSLADTAARLSVPELKALLHVKDEKPKRNRAKPAPAKPRKVVKKGKARPKK